MATHLRRDTHIHTTADICASIAGGLDSDPAARHLAPAWETHSTKVDTYATDRRRLERKLARARARLDVMDAQWDPEAAAFGRDLFDQSGGKRDQAPYTRFFKDSTPSDVQAFGIDREVQQGKAWIAELARNPQEPLAIKWIPRLTLATENLASASTSRHQALQAVALQDTTEELAIDDINRELDSLEGDLLKLCPGQPKRVAAFLEPTKPRRKRSSRSQGEDSE